LNKFSCIILAGGKGERFGGKKQNVYWKGKPLWKHVYDTCTDVSDDVLIMGYSKHGRQGAVYNGLKKVKYDTVVIVEAARPLVTARQIQLLAMIVSESLPSVSYAKKCTNTIVWKGTHIDRKNCYELLVPQAFRTKLLLKAHKQLKGLNRTSDTEMMYEIFGIEPYLFIINGSNLFKITYKGDLKYLDVI